MTDSRMFRSLAIGSLFLLLPLFGACLDQDSVYGDDRPEGTDPPVAANGMVGYADIETGQTVCGNCHAQPQAMWSGTKHSHAWESLQASGHAQEFCEGCHTVSELGNAASEPSGYTSTGSDRFEDVQCESCHGAGSEHMSDPAASQPRPSLKVTAADGTYLNCAECHNGTHHPFVEQWSLSGHTAVAEHAIGRIECIGCHTGQGALLEWGVRADYQEKDSEEPLAIVCSVCHASKDVTFPGQLRFPVETTSIDLHLCARCHDRRSVPDPNSSHGLEPHSPQAELVKGTAGWFPPNSGIAPGTLLNSHGNEVNETLCAKCHVEPFEVTDEATGEFVFQSAGHTFQGIPCLDAQGIPNGETDCEVSQTARSWQGCTGGPCHSNTEGPELLLTNKVENQIAPMAEELIALLEIVDPNLDEVGGEIDATNPVFTVAEGAFFNYHLAYFNGNYRGSATHNPRLIPALLEASIDAVEDEYGVSLP